MIDIGWSEMMVIGVVALIVVGPKDLPKMFHTLGEVTGKARSMAREFQRAMDSAARESGMGDLKKTWTKASRPGQFVKDAIGDTLDDAVDFDDIEREFKSIGREGKPAAKPGSGVTSAPVSQPVGASAKTPAAPEAPAETDDLAARNAALSEVEAERLRAQHRAEANRLKAAAIRARKEAEAAEAAAEAASAKAWRPAPVTPAASGPTPPAPAKPAPDESA